MTIEITERLDDQPTRCLFQKLNTKKEWETYLTVGEYPLCDLRKILVAICQWDKKESSIDEFNTGMANKAKK